LNKTKEALMKSEKPERKQQAASWRVYKSDAAGANGNVTYVMLIDPAVKEADYNIVNILVEAFLPKFRPLFKTYTESFASGLIPINLVPSSTIRSRGRRVKAQGKGQSSSLPSALSLFQNGQIGPGIETDAGSCREDFP
jgi:hypothetical protein